MINTIEDLFDCVYKTLTPRCHPNKDAYLSLRSALLWGDPKWLYEIEDYMKVVDAIKNTISLCMNNSEYKISVINKDVYITHSDNICVAFFSTSKDKIAILDDSRHNLIMIKCGSWQHLDSIAYFKNILTDEEKCWLLLNGVNIYDR